MDELEPEASFFNNRFLNYQQLLFTGTGTVYLKKKKYFKQDQRKKEQSQLNFVIFK